MQQKLDFAEDGDAIIDTFPHNPTPDSATPHPEDTKLPLRGTWGAIYQAITAHLPIAPADRTRWRKDYEENRISPQFSMAPYSHNSLFSVLVQTIRTDLNADVDWVSSKGTIRTDAHCGFVAPLATLLERLRDLRVRLRQLHQYRQCRLR